MSEEKARSIKVKSKNIYALSKLTGICDPRWYLNGVSIFPHESGKGVYMAATNGHYLGLMYDDEGKSNGSYICDIPDILSKTCKPKPVKDMLKRPEFVYFSGDTAYVTCGAIESAEDASKIGIGNLLAVNAPEIDGKYPEILELISRVANSEDENVITVNPKYLKLFANVLCDLGGERGTDIVIKGKNDQASIISSSKCSDFIGLIMPMRNGGTDLPEWLNVDSRDNQE